MHTDLGYRVDFILRVLHSVFNPKANGLSEYAKGSKKMNYFEVADQGVGLHCILVRPKKLACACVT